MLVNTCNGESVRSIGETIEPRQRTFLERPYRPYFTLDGRTLVTKRVEPGSIIIQIWDVATGKHRADIRHSSESPFDDEVMSSDGKAMIVGSREGLTLWDVEAGERLSPFRIEGQWPQLSRDGVLLMSVCGECKRIWNAKTGKELAVIRSDKLVKLSPDGRTLATYHLGEGIIEIWNVDDLLFAAGNASRKKS